MAELADVVIALRARTEDLERDLARARTQLRTFGAGAGSSLDGLTNKFTGLRGAVSKFQTGLLAVVGLGGLSALIKHTLDSASALVDQSDALGVTTDQLQKYGFAARQVGLTGEDVAAALKFIAKAAAESAVPTSKAAQIFAKLKIDPRQFRDIGELFEAAGTAIDRLGTQSERTQARLILFGRAGNNIGRLFLNSGQDLEAFTLQARELGIIIDESLLRQADAAGDKLQVLSDIVKGQLIRAVVSASPLIAQLAQGLGDLAEGAGRFFDLFRETGNRTDISAISSDIAVLTEKVKLQQQEVESARNKGGLFGFLESDEETARRVKAEAQKLDELKAQQSDLLERQRQLTVGGAGSQGGGSNGLRLGAGLGDTAGLERARRKAEEDARRILEATAATRELQGALAALAFPPGFQRDLAQAQATFLKDLEVAGAKRTEEEKAQAAQQAVLSLTIATVNAENEHKKAIQASNDSLKEARQELEIARLPTGLQEAARARAKAFAEFQKAALEAGSDPTLLANAKETLEVELKTITEAHARAESFTSFLQGTAAGAIEDFGRQLSNSFMDADFSFKTFLRTFLAGVARMIVEATTLLAIKQGLSALGGAIGGSIGTGIVDIAGAIRLGSGGVVAKPTFAMVGESGPEAVIPLSRLDSGGGGDVTVVVENNGPPLQVTNSAWEQNGRARRLRLEVRSAVGESIASNDPLSRTFETSFGLERKGIRRG